METAGHAAAASSLIPARAATSSAMEAVRKAADASLKAVTSGDLATVNAWWMGKLLLLVHRRSRYTAANMMTCEFCDLMSSLAARIRLPVVVSQSNYYRRRTDLQKTIGSPIAV